MFSLNNRIRLSRLLYQYCTHDVCNNATLFHLYNKVVLDESTDATRRARTNANLKAKLKKRMTNIKRTLYVRIIVNDDDIIEADEEADCMVENGVEEEKDDEDVFGALANKLRMRMCGDEGVSSPPLAPIPPNVIVVEEDEDGEEEERGMNEPVSSSANEEDHHHSSVVEENSVVAATVLPHQIPLSQKTRGAKSYVDALSCSRRKSNAANLLIRYHRRSISHSTVISMFGGECNICLSQFQVGDHAAWSHDILSVKSGVVLGGNDDTNEDSAKAVCKHVFHEECITRWLLVRDKCPICRETYFLDDQVQDDSPTAHSMSNSSSATNNDVLNSNGSA